MTCRLPGPPGTAWAGGGGGRGLARLAAQGGQARGGLLAVVADQADQGVRLHLGDAPDRRAARRAQADPLDPARPWQRRAKFLHRLHGAMLAGRGQGQNRAS
nr:hypothetical protein [Deinococcus gobiensis]